MHAYSTRALHNHHHRRGKTAAAVVAVLVFVAIATVYGPSLARSAQPSGIELTSAPEAEVLGAEARPGHDIAIEIVAPGREGLELSARLTDDGGLIELPMHWTIRNMNGETVYSGSTPGAEFNTPPGDYAVDIRYDAVRLSSVVTLLESNRLMVSYVLNAGGIRVLPRVKDIGLTTSESRTRIFALSGKQSGKLVAVSEMPGEIVRIPEGDYRVESRFAAGNASAVIDVHVNAGRMTAVEIDHKAGLARLSFVGAPQQAIAWNVRDLKGLAVATAEGLNADVVLVPGSYTASAKIGNQVLSASFEIVSGQSQDVILGN